jgi:uncharacterized Zn ribbon protein
MTSDQASTLTVTVKDANGNVLTGEQVTFAVGSGSGTLSAGTVTTNASGVATATFSQTTPGVSTVAAYLGGTVSTTNQVGSTTTITVTAGTANTASSTFTVSSVSITAVETSTLTVTVKDANGNLLANQDVFFAVGSGSGTLSAGPWTTNVSGVATATFSQTTPGVSSVAAYLGTSAVAANQVGSATSITVSAGAADKAVSTFAVSATSMRLDQTSTLTVTVKDANGNLLANQAVFFAVASGTGSLSAGPWTTNASGVATATFSQSAPGVSTVAAYLGASAVAANQVGSTTTINVTAGTANTANSTFAVSATSVPANGTSTSILTVTVKDANNNLVSGQSVFFTLSGQGSLSAGPWTTNASGVATATYTSSLTPDAAALKAYLGTSAVAANQVGTATITTTAGAYVQFVHNSPAGVVDVKINNTTLVDDFAYQTASTFLPVAADVAMDVSVTTSNGSTTLLTINGATFANNKHYILIAQGGADGKAFEVKVVDYARSTSTLSEAMQFLFSHGVTNGPAVNVERVSTSTPRTLEQLIAVNAAYGSAGNYLTQLNPGITTLQLKASGSVVGQYLFDFGAYAGKSMTLLATGRVGGTGANQLMIIGVDADGKVVKPQVTTSDEVEAELPAVFTVHGNYPNPFNPTTNVRFDLPEQANVRIEVVDVIGRKVMTVAPQTMSAGANKVITIDAARLSSGTYFYRVVAEGATRTFVQGSKFTLVK